MAKFRHIAISVEDPEAVAAWYKEVFGLEEVGRAPVGVYLSDGDINFAILRIPSQAEPGKAHVGVHHFGFMVEDPEETYRKLEANGASRLPAYAGANQFFEVKYKAPDGISFDISEEGWPGTSPVVRTEGEKAATS
jgi:methylmalonyl-CoA/ethylmalonyl-CoA epimerase